MPDDVIVLIGAMELHPPLRARHALDGDLLAFGDDETARALEAILTRRPRAIVIERLFAATSRGAALVSRLKADPALSDVEIRIAAHDSEYVRIVRPAAGAYVRAAPVVAGVDRPSPERAPVPPLDYRGTRRTARYLLDGTVEVLLDGNPATLVNISPLGAQVVSPTIVRPNQRVRVGLPDEVGLVRFNATVVWARYELPGASAAPRYRAGIEFTDPNRAAVDAFIARHREGGRS
jgi:hypothetical protein